MLQADAGRWANAIPSSSSYIPGPNLAAVRRPHRSRINQAEYPGCRLGGSSTRTPSSIANQPPTGLTNNNLPVECLLIGKYSINRRSWGIRHKLVYSPRGEANRRSPRVLHGTTLLADMSRINAGEPICSGSALRIAGTASKDSPGAGVFRRSGGENGLGSYRVTPLGLLVVAPDYVEGFLPAPSRRLRQAQWWLLCV